MSRYELLPASDDTEPLVASGGDTVSESDLVLNDNIQVSESATFDFRSVNGISSASDDVIGAYGLEDDQLLGVSTSAHAPDESFVRPPQPSTSSQSPEVAVRLAAVRQHRPERLESQISVTPQRVETEEKLKCVVTSVLFLGIVATIFVVAFVWNPSI